MTDLAPHELRVLVAVERERSFTAAAALLGLTQSAVSHAVRSCERKTGAVLFDRGRHGARPTPAGERAAVQARRILRLLEALGDEARGAATGEVSGRLRIAAFRSAAAHVLPPALERLGAEHPSLVPEVRIVPDVGRGTAGEVADGRADLAIATLGTAGGAGGLATAGGAGGLVGAALFDEPYALVHPAGSRDPRALPLVDWRENCSSYTRRWWSEQDWIPRTTLDAGDDSVVLSMVAGGLGMAIMPRLALLGAPASVAVTDLGPDRPTREIGYVTTPELARTLAVRALIRALRSTAPALVRDPAPPRNSATPPRRALPADHATPPGHVPPPDRTPPPRRAEADPPERLGPPVVESGHEPTASR